MNLALKRSIKKAVENGISKEVFRSSLEELGWDDSSIENAMQEFELRKFVFEAKKNNIPDSTIRKNLKDFGWTNREIFSVMGGFYIPEINVKPYLKHFFVFIVLIGLLFSGWHLFSSLNFSFGRTNHHLDLSRVEFNETLYNLNVKEYSKDISKLCGNRKSILTGMIVGNADDFSDVKISSNVGSLKVNSIDSSGKFNAEINCVGDAILNFEKQGFVPLHKKVVLSENGNLLNIFLVEENEFKNFNTLEDFEFEEDNIEMQISGGSFNGVDNAKISLTSFDSISMEGAGYFPGDWKGLGPNAEKVGLESFGFFKIKVEDSEGNGLELVENKTMSGSIRIQNSQKGFAPKKIALWNFDESLGTWKYVGGAEKRCSGDCYYDFVLEEVGSWYNVGVPVESTNNLVVNSGFDFFDPPTRGGNIVCRFVSPSYPAGSIKPSVSLQPGESIVTLDEVRTDMVCEPRKVEGHSRLMVTGFRDDVVAGVTLSTRTTTDYIGSGVSQVVVDSEGNELREIPTECTCRQAITTWNRNLYRCDGRDDEGNYYDNCVNYNADFWCEGAEGYYDCSDPCKDFETFKRCNPDFEKFYNAILNFEDVFKDRNGYSPNALDFWRTWASFDGNLVAESATALRGYRVWDDPIKGHFFHKKGFEEVRSNYQSPFIESKVHNTMEGQGLDMDLKRFNVNSIQINMDHVAVGAVVRNRVPSAGIQTLVDYADTTVGNILNIGLNVYGHFAGWGEIVSLKQNLNSWNYRGNIYGQLFGGTRNEWMDKLPSDFFKENFFEVICKKNWQYVSREAHLRAQTGFGAHHYAIDHLRAQTGFGAHHYAIDVADFVLKELVPSITTGNVILDLPKEKDISILEGIDIVSGKIHYPLNNFVYYSELNSFKDKFDGNLVVYDSFISEKNGEYSIGDGSGVFRLIGSNSLIIEGSEIKIEDDFISFEFKEKVGDIYLITKKSFSFEETETAEINYFYEGGRLKKIEYEEDSVIFNYDGNRLLSIHYESDFEGVFIEEYVYQGNKLLQVLYINNDEVFMGMNYSRESNLFNVETPFYTNEYALRSNKVESINKTSLISNESGMVYFEYDGDYTYIISNNYTMSCFKGICFIDELLNMVTTSPKCLDYYPEPYHETLEGDNFVLRVQGVDSSGSFVWNEVNIPKNNIQGPNGLDIPSNANLSLVLELNGVPSAPINFQTRNEDLVNLSSLVDSPKNCQNSQISFGGFSLNNCEFYSGDLNKLSGCLVGSIGMFDSSFEEIIGFIDNLDLNEQAKISVKATVEDWF
jgi:hypothetical protein